MPNPRAFYLTGLMLEFFAQSDIRKLASHDIKTSVEDYSRRTLEVTRAAKRVSHEALTRYMRQDSIPYPWEGETLE